MWYVVCVVSAAIISDFAAALLILLILLAGQLQLNFPQQINVLVSAASGGILASSMRTPWHLLLWFIEHVSHLSSVQQPRHLRSIGVDLSQYVQ